MEIWFFIKGKIYVLKKSFLIQNIFVQFAMKIKKTKSQIVNNDTKFIGTNIYPYILKLAETKDINILCGFIPLFPKDIQGIILNWNRVFHNASDLVFTLATNNNTIIEWKEEGVLRAREYDTTDDNFGDFVGDWYDIKL